MSSSALHFIHTKAFDAAVAAIPMTDDELRQVQATLQANPEAGDMVPGTGGVRKIRAAAKGKGKRGGVRVLYYYVVRRQTVALLVAYDKSKSDDIDEAGKKVLRALAARLDVE